MSDAPTVHHFVRRAVQVGKPHPIVIDPGTGPTEETLHELEAGRRGENISEKERLLDLMRKREYHKQELSSAKDLIRISKEKTAGFQLAEHLLDGDVGFDKEAFGPGLGGLASGLVRGLGRLKGGLGKAFSRSKPLKLKTPRAPIKAPPAKPPAAALTPQQQLGRDVAKQQAAAKVKPPPPPKIKTKPVDPPPPPPTPPVPGTEGTLKGSPNRPSTPKPDAPPTTPPGGSISKETFQQHQDIGGMSDVEALKAQQAVTGKAPGRIKEFLASGKGQFAAQAALMMFPYHKVFGEESAISQVAPLGAFMLAPGAIAKYTGAGAARAGLQKHVMGGGKLPAGVLGKAASRSRFEVTSIVTTPGVVNAG